MGLFVLSVSCIPSAPKLKTRLVPKLLLAAAGKQPEAAGKQRGGSRKAAGGSAKAAPEAAEVLKDRPLSHLIPEMMLRMVFWKCQIDPYGTSWPLNLSNTRFSASEWPHL